MIQPQLAGSHHGQCDQLERVAHQSAILGSVDLNPAHQVAHVVGIGQRGTRIALGALVSA